MAAITTTRDQPLAIKVIPTPIPGPGQVLIDIAYAGINRPDLLQRMGVYPPPPGAPDTMGLECSGRIVALGEGISRWKLGDTVCALLSGGGYAEYALADEGSCLTVPEGLSMLEAAAIPETIMTVWTNVFERGALKAGEHFLVHGGASGIGTIAIQMAKAQGAIVFATAGGAEKAALCAKLGANYAIDYHADDFVEVVRANGGADVILDMVGGPYAQRNIDAMNPDGRCVQIAFLQGPQVQINLAMVMMKRLTLTGSTLRARPLDEKARIARAVEAHVWPWIASGQVRPVIDSVYHLDQAEQAQARMTANVHAGKIMLDVGGEV
jgi:putative PIG3 family NAD(P)H quinone oxidoreductase